MNPNHQRSRRYVNICREGWYFVFILAFIVLGSILRQINLLVILASMMVAPLLFNWRIAVAMIRKITTVRQVPSYVHAGQTFVVEHQVRNRSGWLSAWDVKITDRISPQFENRDPTDIKTTQNQIDAIVAQVNPGDSAYVSYRCYLARRGVYEFGPVTISSKFPLGLVSSWFHCPSPGSLHVAPPIGQLTPQWHKRISSIAAGSTSTERRRGLENDEFYGLRAWTNGDSRRWIHWRSTARRGELMVKQFDQPSDRDIAILLDLWALETNQSRWQERIELAASFVATVIKKLNHNVQGRVAISICGDHTFVLTNQNSNDFNKQVMKSLAVTNGASNTDIGIHMVDLSRRVSRGTPVIVVSTRDQPDKHEICSPEQSAEVEPVLNYSQWLSVDSAEFRQMFQPFDPVNNRGLQSLSESVSKSSSNRPAVDKRESKHA